MDVIIPWLEHVEKTKAHVLQGLPQLRVPRNDAVTMRGDVVSTMRQRKMMAGLVENPVVAVAAARHVDSLVASQASAMIFHSSKIQSLLT